jgi:hypothetical protein
MEASVVTSIFISVFLVASARADLHLTPKVAEYEQDGAKFKHLVFTAGDKEVTYSPPRGWEYFGSANQLTLRPPNKAQAEATISRISHSEPEKSDEESVKENVAEAVALVPKSSENVTVISQEKNPLLINRKETFLVILGYNLFGQAYNRSVLFLNRGNEQIRFQLVCHQADFKELQKAFLGSQYTWKNL